MIDTEIIVRKVENEVTRAQNKLMFSLMENTYAKGSWPPVAEPFVFFA